MSVGFNNPTGMIAVARASGPAYLVVSGMGDGGAPGDAGTLSLIDPLTGSVTVTNLDEEPLTLTSGDLYADGGTEIVVMQLTHVGIFVPDDAGYFVFLGSIPLPSDGGFGAASCNDQGQILVAHDEGDGGPDIIAFCASGPTLAASYSSSSYAYFDRLDFRLPPDGGGICSGVDSISAAGAGTAAAYAFNCPSYDPSSGGAQPDTQVFFSGSIGGWRPTYSLSTGLANVYPAAETYLQDLDGDGVPDLLVLDSAPDGGGVAVRYCAHNGQTCSDGGGFTAVEPGPLSFAMAGFGDLNGDGAPDVAIFGIDTGPTVAADGGLILGTFSCGDGGLCGGYDAFLQLMLRLPDGGMSEPSLIDVQEAFDVAQPETSPGPAIAVGDFFNAGASQIAVLTTGGVVTIMAASCH